MHIFVCVHLCTFVSITDYTIFSVVVCYCALSEVKCLRIRIVFSLSECRWWGRKCCSFADLTLHCQCNRFCYCLQYFQMLIGISDWIMLCWLRKTFSFSRSVAFIFNLRFVACTECSHYCGLKSEWLYWPPETVIIIEFWFHSGERLTVMWRGWDDDNVWKTLSFRLNTSRRTSVSTGLL